MDLFEITDEEGTLPREVLRTKGFESELGSIQYWNKTVDQFKMPKIRAEKLLNVPLNAYKTLNGIPVPVCVAERHIVSIWRDKEHTKV